MMSNSDPRSGTEVVVQDRGFGSPHSFASRPQTEKESDAPRAGDQEEKVWSPIRMDIPASNLDLDLDQLLDDEPTKVEVEKFKKRASNVMKLTQENEKLQAELKAMSERLEAAERRREALEKKAEIN
ncbi:hypothetical protein HGRIS_013115 [Hohenbuehelia grisea]|uniref:Uncharacterized protein n=1 Tax=Hohenbuehelia grisea TaxID=104357 RepID=A0ABR3IUH2_9AGAR